MMSVNGIGNIFLEHCTFNVFFSIRIMQPSLFLDPLVLDKLLKLFLMLYSVVVNIVVIVIVNTFTLEGNKCNHYCACLY